MGQIIISNKKGFWVFQNKREALEWIQERADFLKWGVDELDQKQTAIYKWIEWDYLFNPSKYTVEDVLCNIKETKDCHVVENPQDKKIILQLWKEHHKDEE